MTPEVKAQWVEALRSGKYKQARKALKENDGFCCLGVLCDLIDPEGWEDHGGTVYFVMREELWQTEGEYGETELNSEYVSEDSLPSALSSEIGIDSKTEVVLIAMNDGREESQDPSTKEAITAITPKSFAEIADYIEATL